MNQTERRATLEPGAICEGPVRAALARPMFTELGLRRFLHQRPARTPG